MIELRNVDVIFHNKDSVVPAVKNVNLSVAKGEIFGIIGYSGAGKSTLLRTINLLQVPTHGEVIVNGQNMLELNHNELRAARKKIGMIFQHFNLMDSRTVADNVGIPLRKSGLSKNEQLRRVSELLNLVGLSDKANNYPSQLSGGQKQRVAIARALANEPDVLLSDEATSALDPKTTTSILNLLRKLNQELGLTIVMITHEMSVIKDLCHRVAVMEAGTVVEQGGIVDILTNPQRVLTKNFINMATHFDQEMEIVMNHPSTLSLTQRGEIVRISYIGDQTMNPIISELVERFGVTANILYGHIEIVDNQPIGHLLIGLEGNAKQIEQAVLSMVEKNVRVQRYNELVRDYVMNKEEGGSHE